MLQRISWILALILVINASSRCDAATPSFSSEIQSERIITLTHEIRCVVCQGESIAESDAPLADNLRRKIQMMILENKSDEDIKHYLTTRYGEFILLKPRWAKTTGLLWLFPLITMVSGLMLLLRYLRSTF